MNMNIISRRIFTVLASLYNIAYILFLVQYSQIWRGVIHTTLCDKVCQRLATGRWFSPDTPVSITNKTDHHDITEILLKVALNTINQPTNISAIIL